MNRQEAINHVLDWFDFHRAAKQLEHVEDNWLSRKAKDESLHYKVAMCREFTRRLLNGACDAAEHRKGEAFSSTGCFEARAIIEDGNYYVSLKYVGEEWDNFI